MSGTRAKRNFRSTGRLAGKPGTPATVPVSPTLRLNETELRQGADQFNDWHWGLQPLRVVDWNDPDMPAMLIECGRLVRLHVRAPRGNARRHPRQHRDAMIEFSARVSANSHLAYDPEHPYERLYLLVDSAALSTLRDRFWKDNTFKPMNLNQLAQLAGGRHSTMADYPHIQVKPIGILTAVVYQTTKKGDGLSYYIHKVGEISAIHPILAVDEQGRLWLAGGNTTSPPPGVTD